MTSAPLFTMKAFSAALSFACLTVVVCWRAFAAEPVPDKLVVLTFDDSVSSQANYVAPLLKKHGFGATFFITEGFDFATNKTQYMTWEQIKGLHDAGFEIGNHTRHHHAVNGQKAAQIEAGGVQARRGSVRDALTVFDENAALLSAPQALWDALLARQWQRLFLELRPLWREARLVLFGHALLEKLVHPRKAVTAHVYRGLPAMDSIADLDAWVAADLGESGLASKPFVPLPVLGVPGWWPANASPDFYDDATVFRPRPAQAINRMKREESAPIP